MQIETKFLRLCQPVTLGVEIDGWRVCWLGGWGKHEMFYFVMVMRVIEKPKSCFPGKPVTPVRLPAIEGI